MAIDLVMPWRKLWRSWSVRCIALIPIIEGIQVWLPSAQDLFEPSTWKAMTIGITIAAIILRNIPQPKLEEFKNGNN